MVDDGVQQKSAKRAKIAGQIPLANLVEGVFSDRDLARSFFRGTIISNQVYNSSTQLASITLQGESADDSQEQCTVELKSPRWAQPAFDLLPLGESVIFGAVHAQIKRHNVADDDPQSCTKFKVLFKEGIAFSVGGVWYRFGKHEVKPEIMQKNGSSVPGQAPTSSGGAAATNPASSSSSTVLKELGQGDRHDGDDSHASGAVMATKAPRANPRGGKGIPIAQRNPFTTKLGVKYTQLSKMDKGKSNAIVVAIATRRSGPVKPGSSVTDWMVGAHLYDASQEDYVACNFFAFEKTKQHLPDPGAQGSVLIVHNLTRNRNDLDKNQATVFKDRLAWSLLSVDDLIDGKVEPVTSVNVPHIKFGAEEIEYATQLAYWWRSKVDKPISQGKPIEPVRSAAERSRELAKRGGSSVRPFIQLKDVTSGILFNCVAEVVRVHNSFEAKSCSLFVIDYTENSDFYAYSDYNEAWTGPDGQLVFQISVWGDANCDTCDLLERGDIVYLNNVRGKLNPENFLEGTLWEDPKFPTRPDITRQKIKTSLYQAEIQAMIKRREAYWTPVEKREAPAEECQPASLTGRVNCQFADQPIAKFSVALQTEREGLFRLRGRVVDFKPASLQDWISALCVECDTVLEPQLNKCLDHEDTSPELHFSFHLAIREEGDSGDVIHIYAGPINALDGSSAMNDTDVLPGLKPTLDMRAGGSDVAALRKRMAVALGQLEACKRRKTNARESDLAPPFDFVVHKMQDAQGRWIFCFYGTTFED